MGSCTVAADRSADFVTVANVIANAVIDTFAKMPVSGNIIAAFQQMHRFFWYILSSKDSLIPG